MRAAIRALRDVFTSPALRRLQLAWIGSILGAWAYIVALGVDTLIVTGVSTSHCVYATCRDATDSFRVIVPREAVGERCELMHEVNLLDIELDLGDVRPTDDVVEYLRMLPGQP